MEGTCYSGLGSIFFVPGALLSVRFPPWEDLNSQKKSFQLIQWWVDQEYKEDSQSEPYEEGSYDGHSLVLVRMPGSGAIHPDNHFHFLTSNPGRCKRSLCERGRRLRWKGRCKPRAAKGESSQPGSCWKCYVTCVLPVLGRPSPGPVPVLGSTLLMFVQLQILQWSSQRAMTPLIRIMAIAPETWF